VSILRIAWGAGQPADFTVVFEAQADAALAASIFHF
jgi:imidazole glycerol phosphate synthase subunit HisF